MAARVEYKASVERDLRKLGQATALRVTRKIEKTLGQEGQREAALSGEFAGLYRLRVGNYRAVYAQTDEGYLLLRIAHRRDVYRQGQP